MIVALLVIFLRWLAVMIVLAMVCAVLIVGVDVLEARRDMRQARKLREANEGRIPRASIHRGSRW